MTTSSHKLAASLVEVSLIDAAACANVGSMSVSWWHEEVRAGRAPQPVIRKPRCTRWRVSDVRDFWQGFAHSGLDGADALMAVTKKASVAANAKRTAVAGTDSAKCVA